MSRICDNISESEKLPHPSWVCEGPSFSFSEIPSLFLVILLDSFMCFHLQPSRDHTLQKNHTKQNITLKYKQPPIILTISFIRHFSLLLMFQKLYLETIGNVISRNDSGFSRIFWSQIIQGQIKKMVFQHKRIVLSGKIWEIAPWSSVLTVQLPCACAHTS